MRKIQIGLLILILGLALVLQGCGGASNPGGDNPHPTATPAPGSTPTPTPIPVPSNIIHITASIDAPTTWTSDNLYVLDNGIFVNNVLTIKRGTIIKIGIGNWISVSSTGAIDASDGTSDAPITFTSLRDDSVGGNTDGSALLPAKGNWMDIKVGGTSSVFNHCRFYYGGSGGYEYDALVEATANAVISFTNCTFAHSQNSGLSLRSSLETSTVTGNTFFDTTKPLWIACAITLDNSNVFHDPALPTQGNAFNAIWIDGGTIRTSAGWGETEVPFVLKGGISVESGDTLTLQPGVIIKTTTGSINGGGSIVAVGTPTNHIVFTSYKDDTVGGDTDNVPGAASHGDWGKLYFGANGSNLTYCDIFYGGSTTLPITQVLSGASIIIDHCNIAHSDNIALDIQGAAKNSTITNNAFYDTTKPVWMSPDTSFDGSNIFHNPANPSETNLKNGIWLANSIAVSTARTWGVSEVPYISDLGFYVNTGATLSIAKGAILKFVAPSAAFCISNGASVAVIGGVFTDITFTSIYDDARGGDSDGDGGATLPATGNWAGVKDFNGTAHWETTTNIHYDTNSGNL